MGEDLAEDDEAFARVEPFSLVKDELGAISERMRRAASEVPALKTAAEYFFRTGSEGKRATRSSVPPMASALGRCRAPGARRAR